MYAKVHKKGNCRGAVRRFARNGDGVVNVNDVTEIQRIVAELHTPDSREQAAADVDRDGAVSVGDATRLQNYLAEYINKL